MCARAHPNDPRTRPLLERQALDHFRLARTHLGGRTNPGLDRVVVHVDSSSRDLEIRHGKHPR